VGAIQSDRAEYRREIAQINRSINAISRLRREWIRAEVGGWAISSRPCTSGRICFNSAKVYKA